MLFNNRQSALNEVVVVGYGAQRKASLTAAVSVVRADEIGTTAQLGNMLQGKVAGLQITQSGNFLQTPSIRLRGSSTVTGNHEPLFILNGVPMDGFSLNTLNPNDIDNITVLKDGNATALMDTGRLMGPLLLNQKLRRERIKLKFKNPTYYTSQQFNTSGTSYTPVRRFYASLYETLVKTEERSDFRETIYWNPVVQTNKEGKAEIDFFIIRMPAPRSGLSQKGLGSMVFPVEPKIPMPYKVTCGWMPRFLLISR